TPIRDLGIRGDVSSEDVVRSELPAPESGGDLGSPENGDSGRTLARSKRDMVRLAPYWFYRLSERNRLEFDGRYVDAKFDNQEGQNLQDFSATGVSAGWRRAFSERSSFVIRAVASEFETSFKTDSYGVDLQWDREFS